MSTNNFGFHDNIQGMADTRFCDACKIILLQLIAGCLSGAFAEINLARGKTATYCNEKIHSEMLFDGDTDKDSFIPMDGRCQIRAFVNVLLEASYVIDYVIVYEGNGNTAGQLDFFEVGRSGTATDLCSDFPGITEFARGYRGFRVNCESVTNFHSSVSIESHINRGLFISEIEIFSFGPGIADQSAMIFRGCYVRMSSIQGDMDLESCQKKCYKNGFIFAGIRANKTCACDHGSRPRDARGLQYCRFKCADGLRFCGGKKGYSVYLIRVPLPFYRGCLRTTASYEDSLTFVGKMSVRKCIRFCDDHKYALLQDGDSCKCRMNIQDANVFPSKFKPCNVRCSDDKHDICGGSRTASVYLTCKVDRTYSACSELFNCDGNYNMYGVCGGECKPGFVGPHCLERENPCLNNPCLGIPHTSCIINESVSISATECICLKGYIRKDSGSCELKPATAIEDDDDYNDDIDDKEDIDKKSKPSEIDMTPFLFMLAIIITALVLICLMRGGIPSSTSTPRVSESL